VVFVLAQIKLFDVMTDSERLDWIIEHRALVFLSSRMKTRRGGFSKDNKDPVYIVDWDELDGTNIILGVEEGKPTAREAIDHAANVRAPKWMQQPRFRAQ
jgi:hypothetical protein